jgi:Ser/Thr protein kinase RdoA (MazF antagonist)
MRRIGNRLGRLHTLTSEGFRALGDDDRSSANLIHIENSFAQRMGDKLSHRIQWLLDEIEGRRLPACRIHGDLTPHNLFFNPRTGAVNIIDFNLRSSVALEDIVIFEVGLELMTERHPLGRRPQYFRLVDAFRAGYRETGLHNRLPTSTLRALKLGYYCKYLEKIREGANSVAQHITHLTDPPVVERRIRMLVNTEY